MSSKRNTGLRLGSALAASLLICASAAAEPQRTANDGAWRLAQAAPAPEAGAAAGAKTQPVPQPGADAGLRQRVEQLEEQLVDMQVVIGTLESLATRGAAPAAPSSYAPQAGPVDDARIEGLETQVRALTAQIEQLTTQVRALAAAPPGRTDAVVAPPPTTETVEFPAVAPAGQPLAQDPSADRFGSTTVTAGRNDAIGGLIANETPAGPPAGDPGTTAPAGSESVAVAPPAFMPPPVDPQDAANPKQLYETAYGYLMQRDYGAAQAAFEDFLTRYPNDSLAGNAQYWLGEAHFVRGDYKSAAGAFLKGYQDYAGNARAADSLLRLAMSLDRLGQRDAACSSYSELSTRFPDAPENVKLSAQAEQKRIGCR